MKLEALRQHVSLTPHFDHVLRYEANLERSFDRTLTQLEHLQRMRLGQPVPPKVEVHPFFILSDKRKRRERERAQALLDWILGAPFFP